MSVSLNVSEAAVGAIAAGRPVLALSEIPRGADVAAGRPVRLLDARGQELAVGIADPENDVIRIYGGGAVTFNPEFFRRRVEAALVLRRQLGLIDTTTCRLLHAEGDRLSGFAADRFGDFAVLWVYSRALVEHGRVIAACLREALGLRGVVLKLRPRGGSTAGAVKQETLGDEPPDKLTVHEHGVPFEVHLLGGLNVGLFTDMREHRRGLARFAAGRRVLNAFAYTGALSVTAALAGASSVTSVDLSSGVLKWAAENFRLSGLDPAAHRFEVSDVPRWVERAGKAGEQFDLVILDPPTFSTARASGWSLKTDYAPLIASAIALFPEETGGILWISANTVGEQRLLKLLDQGLKRAGRRAQILELGGLPPDYPTLPSYPESRYLEVCLVRIC